MFSIIITFILQISKGGRTIRNAKFGIDAKADELETSVHEYKIKIVFL